jgi:hypothetical protein
MKEKKETFKRPEDREADRPDVIEPPVPGRDRPDVIEPPFEKKKAPLGPKEIE